MSYCNTSSLAVLMLFAYVFYVGAGFRRIMNPHVRVPEPGEQSLDPLWREGQPFDISCFIRYVSVCLCVIPYSYVHFFCPLVVCRILHRPAWYHTLTADLLHVLLLPGSTSPDDLSIGAGPIWPVWRETGLSYTWTASATSDRPLTLVPPGSAEVNGTVVMDSRLVDHVFMCSCFNVRAVFMFIPTEGESCFEGRPVPD